MEGGRVIYTILREIIGLNFIAISLSLPAEAAHKSVSSCRCRVAIQWLNPFPGFAIQIFPSLLLTIDLCRFLYHSFYLSVSRFSIPLAFSLSQFLFLSFYFSFLLYSLCFRLFISYLSLLFFTLKKTTCSRISNDRPKN